MRPTLNTVHDLDAYIQSDEFMLHSLDIPRQPSAYELMRERAIQLERSQQQALLILRWGERLIVSTRGRRKEVTADLVVRGLDELAEILRAPVIEGTKQAPFKTCDGCPMPAECAGLAQCVYR